jgi:hypothetical protein
MAERNLPHIVLRGRGLAERYQAPPRAMGASEIDRPAHRAQHGRQLLSALAAAEESGVERRLPAPGTPDDERGVYVVFESFPGIELELERLDPQVGRFHPELRTVRPSGVGGTIEQAVVWIPNGKVGHFLRRLEQYIESAGHEKPRHMELVDRIAAIRLATIEALWTDAPELFPEGNARAWWEVWLRRRDGAELERLRAFAEEQHAEVAPGSLAFADRIVALVHATPAQLSGALDVLDDLAELRRPNPHATMLAAEPAVEQAAWVADLEGRTVPAPPGSPAVTVVDTGVHREHPLLMRSLALEDCHACDPGWGVHDHHGHGTQMAGLALYGSLEPAFVGTGPVQLSHGLESVKFLPPTNDTPQELWGAMTADAAARVEIQAPARARVFAVATTADLGPVDGDRAEGLGQPTAWSATVDALAAGFQVVRDDAGMVTLNPVDDREPRLFVLAAGNVDDYTDDYLATCDLHPIEDPAQAWNGLTVGAMTELVAIAPSETTFAGWTPLAQHGDLSPHSRTSVLFDRPWPLKPDVVVEGGNVARSPDGTRYECPDSMQLLTTRRPRHEPRLLGLTSQTSAATAKAAHLAAAVRAAYPALWPETVRALVAHSAVWTPAMLAGAGRTRPERSLLRRRYGMGVPDLLRATRSASDALTLVAEDVIHPFADGRMNEMHFHRLPWPEAELAALGELPVTLRVTLSYFVEPNPARRGWAKRYDYQSHGLRFDLRRPTEGDADFRRRVNGLAREENEERVATATDAPEWFLGPTIRSAGSLHSDVWKGDAVGLARRGVIAVYPVAGWWKERKRLDRSSLGARYALVVSIETPPEAADIYTPVAIQAGVAVMIET